jgi:tetratricopeptide (TPR) repeat protein
MNINSEKIIKIHLNKMRSILRADGSNASTFEKRITQGFIQRAQKLFEKNSHLFSSAGNNLAEDSFEKISYYIDLTLKTVDKISSPILDEAHKAKFIYILSETYQTLGNYEAALANYKKAYDLALEKNNLILQGQIHCKMAKIWAEMGNWKEADFYLNSALTNLQNTGDFSGVAFAKLEMAKIAYKKGEYLAAENLFQAALEASEFVNDISNTAFINHHLGIILRMQGKYEQAFQYFQRALIEFQSIQDRQGTAESLNNLGVIHLKNKELPNAIGYFDKALEICQNSGVLPLMAFINLNKAEFYTEIGDFPMATTACGKALEILIQLKNPVGIAKTNNLLGRIFWKCGDFELAKSFYQEGIRLYDEFGIKLGLGNSYEEYASMLKEAGETGEAKKNSKKAQEVFDNLDIIINIETEKVADLIQ